MLDEWCVVVVGAVVVLLAVPPAHRGWVGVLVLVLLLAHRARARRESTFAFHLVDHDALNESIVLRCRLHDRDTLFLLDTGYAGPPVLSASYLAVDDPTHRPVRERYAAITRQLERSVTVDAQHAAIDTFVRRNACKVFTSGCTMRLMGIGATEEQQADMFMCEMLQLETVGGGYAQPKTISRAHADVFVTNPLPTSIHILTNDFLLHASPAYIDLRRRRLALHLGADEALALRVRCHLLPARFSGGAFVVELEVGGHPCRCTVDTGSPGPISLDHAAAKHLARCERANASLQQAGVNGEDICSEVVATDVRFVGRTFARVPVFVNSHHVDHVDGYVGLGFLRAFNLLLTPDAIGFIPNGQPMTTVDAYVAASGKKSCGLELGAC